MRTMRFLAVGALALIGACAAPASPDPAPASQTPTRQAEPKADPRPGSRENPLTPGTEFTVGDYRLTFGETSADQTEAIMQEEADRLYSGDLSWVTSPEPGHILVVVPVTGTYSGQEAGDPGLDLSTAYVGPSGKVYSEYSFAARPENDLWRIGQMYAGTQFSATITAEVPEGDVEGGVWRLGETFSLSDSDVFVATK